MPAAKRNGVQSQPIIPESSPKAPEQTPKKTPELAFPARDPAHPKLKQNQPRAFSKEAKNLEAHPERTSMAPPLRNLDATAAPVRQQLSDHFNSSLRPASHEYPPDRGSNNETIGQAVPEETTAERIHALGAKEIGMPQVPEPKSGPPAKKSKAGRDSHLKKDLTLKQQQYQKPEELEPFTAPKKKRFTVFTPEVVARLKAKAARLEAFYSSSSLNTRTHVPDGSKKRFTVFTPEVVARLKAKAARFEALYSSNSSNTRIHVPDGSKKHTQKPRISTKVVRVQNGLRTNRNSAPRQRKRQIEDDTDDDEEKLQVPAKKQKVTIKMESSSMEASIKTEEAKALEVQKNGKSTSSSILKQSSGDFKASPSVPALSTKSQPASTTPPSAKPTSRPIQAPNKRKSKRSRFQ